MIHRAKHLLLDIVGVALILVSPLLGPLPGPGGIPIFVAGLSLLAVNHEWAKRLLESVKKHGLNLLDAIFTDHPVLKAVYDLLSATLIFGGIYLLNVYTRNLTLTLAIFLIFTGVGLFVGNRKRLQRFTFWLKRR